MTYTHEGDNKYHEGDGQGGCDRTGNGSNDNRQEGRDKQGANTPHYCCEQLLTGYIWGAVGVGVQHGVQQWQARDGMDEDTRRHMWAPRRPALPPLRRGLRPPTMREGGFLFFFPCLS